MRSKALSLLFISLSAFLGCSIFNDDDYTKPVVFDIKKGMSSLNEDVAKLTKAKGVVPNGMIVPADAEVVRRDHTSSYEFFIFDTNETIVILSYDPVYYIRIESREYNFLCNSEYEQIKANKTGTAKTINHLPKLKRVGQYEIEVYFTPRELNFSGSTSSSPFRITQNNSQSRPKPDLFRFYGAAQNVWFYTPSFSDFGIHDDFTTDAYDKGKKRIIWTNSSSFNNPVNYHNVAKIMNFSWMMGEDLTITEDLLDGELIQFQDRFELKQDFAAFFSVPIGNGKDTATTPNLEETDGVVVVVRGQNLDRIKRFFQREGFNFQEENKKGIRIKTTDQKPNLLVDWEVDSSVDVYVGFGTTDGVTLPTSSTPVTGSTYTHNLSAATRGYYFQVELREQGSSTVIATSDSFQLLTDEFKITEIGWVGSLESGGTAHDNDEFLEIKNISGSALNLNTLNFNIQENSSNEFNTSGINVSVANNGYFVFYRETGNIFSAANLNLSAAVAANVSMNLSGSGSTLALVHGDGRVIDTVKWTSSKGSKENFERKSAVLKSDASDLTDSAYDIGNAGVSAYTGKTFMTPGFSTSSEY